MADDIEQQGGSWSANPPISAGSYSYSGPVSAHVGNTGVPQGGNFLFEDGHVEWIKLAIGPASGVPTTQYPTISKAAAGSNPVNIYFLYPVQYGTGPW
jgi:prepilin-type processing-associated H-X9-DG protein